MNKIFFDHQTFSLHRFGGVSRVFTREIEGLQKYSDLQIELGIVKSENENLLNSTLKHYYYKFPFQFKGKTKLTYFLNGLYSRFRLATNSYDIIHPTLTDTYFLPYLKKSKLVITIHDLVPILYPEMMGKSNEKIGDQMKLLAPKADHIIAVSHATKADIIEHLRIPEERITVAQLGGIDNTEPIAPTQKLPAKYILYDGVRDGYKNFKKMLHAIVPILKTEDIYLICMGKTFTDFEKALFSELGVSEKILHQHVPNDNVLLYMFKNATLFVYPSFKEGFGIPLLQAFSFGTTVAASDIAIFKEVAQDQAFYFDPNSEESILATVRNALNAPKTEIIQERRKSIYRSFSWKRHVDTLYQAYKSLL